MKPSESWNLGTRTLSYTTMDQQRLEETLLQFYYSNHSTSFSDKDEYGSMHLHEDSEIRILDTICTVLTTGKPKDLYAAAFDKETHLKLVLAKNGIVSPEDRAAVQQLVDLILSPTLPDTYLDFLLTRCNLNIAKQAKDVHDTMAQFLEVIDDALASYLPARRLTDEFPNGFDTFCEVWYRNKPLPITTHENICGLFHAILHLSDELKISDGYQQRDISTFGLLVHTATLALKSRFLRYIYQREDVPGSKQRQFLIQKLKHCLAELSQYMGGIDEVIICARHCRESGIDICWANPEPNNVEEAIVEPVDYITAICHNLPQNVALTNMQIRATFERAFPYLTEDWKRNLGHTCVHAEIWIILYFLQKNLNAPGKSNKPQPIGCSKQNCLACTLRNDASNTVIGTNWAMSRAHGKSYAGWATGLRKKLNVFRQKVFCRGKTTSTVVNHS